MMNRAVLKYVAVLAGLSVPMFGQAPPQDPNYQDYPPQPSYQQPAYGQQPQPSGPQLSPQELSNLVAPIALYPDMLLSQVLAASTYPVEIGQARLFMQQNPGLRGQQLIDAAKQQNWDPSVQALVAFPQVIDLLTRDYQWTTALGNAFLSQQAAVMDAIQQLRAQARDNGRLTNTPQERIAYEQQNGQSAIEILPSNPQMVYAPVYNPAYVWGPPAYGYYPALDYPGLGLGIVYGVGTFLGGLFAGLFSFGGWGWGFGWLSHGLFLNGLFFSHFGFHGYGGYGFHGGPGYAARAAWVHNPAHRLGVPYGGHYAAASYGGRSFSAARGGNTYAGSSRGASNYAGGNRQAEAYRGLTSGAARSGAGSSLGGTRSAEAYRGLNSSAARTGGSYNTARSFAGSGSSFGAGRGWSQPSAHNSAARSFSGSSHYSAPKSSGRSGGGGGGHSHSSGGGHSHGGGGGHSHGGGHKK
jgi:hypothetical protein